MRGFNGGDNGNQHGCPMPGCTGQVYPNQKVCKVCGTDVKQLRKKQRQEQHAVKPNMKAAVAIKKTVSKALACASRCPGLDVIMVFKRPNIRKPVYRGEQ